MDPSRVSRTWRIRRRAAITHEIPPRFVADSFAAALIMTESAMALLEAQAQNSAGTRSAIPAYASTIAEWSQRYCGIASLRTDSGDQAQQQGGQIDQRGGEGRRVDRRCDSTGIQHPRQAAQRIDEQILGHEVKEQIQTREEV